MADKYDLDFKDFTTTEEYGFRHNTKGHYPATEIAYIGRLLSGEVSLINDVSLTNVQIYLKAYKRKVKKVITDDEIKKKMSLEPKDFIITMDDKMFKVNKVGEKGAYTDTGLYLFSDIVMVFSKAPKGQIYDLKYKRELIK